MAKDSVVTHAKIVETIQMSLDIYMAKDSVVTHRDNPISNSGIGDRIDH